jgi:hypothetical protein
MGDIQLGDVPAWIGAGTGVAALFRGITQRRQAQFQDWGELLAELSGLEAEELRAVVEDNPAITEIVGLAWEEAARTASEDKRYLLAKVAAAALRGEGIPVQVDILQFFLRTVMALDPAHIALLVIIGTDKDGRSRDVGSSWVGRREMMNRWMEAGKLGDADIVDPALAALEGEGLVQRVSIDNEDLKRILEKVEDMARGKDMWELRPYGRRFLNFLLIDAGGWPPAARVADSSPSTPTK